MTDPSPTSAPASKLDYSYMTNRGRPGILTAISVISIVVACLSGLGSLWSAVGSVGYYIALRLPPAAFPTPPPAPPPATTAPTSLGSAPTTTSIVSSSSYTVTFFPGPGGTVTTATTMPAGGPGMTGNPFSNVSPVAVLLSIFAALLSLAIAIFLLVAGIQVLRDSPSGAKLHWRYVLLKIPLVIFATGVGLWLSSSTMNSMMASMPGGTAGSNASLRWVFMLVGAIIPACFALAYPVALIFVLKSKSVREYYNTVRQ
ncbi:MAG: hypothetical protein QOF78_4091 [Phycisphaerales bacterium]|nr:hypothetical protein [Phycisphaerales bacterium]